MKIFSSRYLAKVIILSGIILIIGSIIILSLVPPVSKDELTHHLLVPKLYIKKGKIYEIPSIGFSYYPMNLELLFALPLIWGKDIIPKFIHFSFALLTSGLIFLVLQRKLNSLYALAGVLFFLSLPIIIKLSITAYVDLGLSFFSFAAMLCIFKWIKEAFKLRYLIGAGIFCGLALGTKYNALIGFFIFCALIPFVFSYVTRSKIGAYDHTKDIDQTKASTQKVNKRLNYRTNTPGLNSKAIGYALVFLSIALLTYSPWLVRNYRWTKNPIFPLYNDLFSNKAPDSPKINGFRGFDTGRNSKPVRMKTNDSTFKLNHFIRRNLIYKESWLAISLIPIRIFFQGTDENPQFFDGRLSPFLFLLPIAAIFTLRNAKLATKIEIWIMFVFTVLFILIAFLKVDMRIRYILPVVPPLVILSFFGLREVLLFFSNTNNKAMKVALLSILSIAFCFHTYTTFTYIQSQFVLLNPLTYISGQIQRDQYISFHRKEYPAIQFANNNLKNNDKILAIFLGNRGYYSDRAMVHSVNVFRRIVKRNDSIEKVSKALLGRGFTHLLIRHDLFNHWINNNFNDDELILLSGFFKKHVIQEFYQNGYGLYKIRNID